MLSNIRLNGIANGPDTLTCIAGGIAEAYFGVPEDIAAEGRKRLPKDMLEVLDRFTVFVEDARRREIDPFLDGNKIIEDAISGYYNDLGEDALV